jgi:hypothetical protein
MRSPLRTDRFSTRTGTTTNGGGGGYGGRAEGGDARLEEDRGAREGGQDADGELSGVAAVAGLFLGKQKHSARRLVGPATSGAPPFVGVLPSGMAGARRRLQSDLATMAMAPRPPVVPGGGGHRARHNLAAKLDTIARTSPWMRRRVILGDEKGIRSLFRSAVPPSPRHAGGTGNNGSAGNAAGGTSSNGRSTGSGEAGRGHDAAAEAEMEKRIMAAFSRSEWRFLAHRNVLSSHESL